MLRRGNARIRQRNIPAVAGLVCLALSSGCVSVHRTTDDGTRQTLRGGQIRAYAEQVFRRHNAVTSELMHELVWLEDGSDDGDDRAAALTAAEDEMLHACAALDLAAAHYRDGEGLGLMEKRRLVRALPGCEQATRAARRLLDGMKQ